MRRAPRSRLDARSAPARSRRDLGGTVVVLVIALGLPPALAAAPAPAAAAPAAPAPVPPASGSRAPSKPLCPPLEVPLPPPARVEASSLSAAVAAAEHWIRRVAPDVCITKVASVDTSGTEGLTLELNVSVDGHPIGGRVALGRACVPETKAGCGGREDDWHPMPPGDQWLSSRVLNAASASLRAHPEIVRMGGEELGLGSWNLRRVETTAGSSVCVQDGAPWVPPSYRACWNDPRPIPRVWPWGFSWPARKPTPEDDFQFQTDHVRGFLTLGPFGGQDELWAVRFPEAERVFLGPRPDTRAVDDLRPGWFLQPERHRPAKQALPTQGWQPIPTQSPPDLGDLGLVEVTLVASDAQQADLTAVDLVAGVGTTLCARRNGSWSCGPPTFTESDDTFPAAGHERAQSLPSHDGPPWLLVQRSTIEDGGNGDGSGAGGNQFLEIYRQAGGTLRPIGSIVLGRMEWTTKRRRDGYWRSIARYAHAYSVAGPDCIRIERAGQHRGWADGSFVSADPPGTRRSHARLPSVLVPGVVTLTGIPTVHEVSQDSHSDVEAQGDSRVVLRDFSGLWCLEANRLVRKQR